MHVEAAGCELPLECAQGRIFLQNEAGQPVVGAGGPMQAALGLLAITGSA